MGAAVAVLEGHTDMVFAVRFSSEGDFLASASLSDKGSGSRSVLLWRCRDRINVAALPRQEVRAIGGLDFHPSRPLLAAKDRALNR